MSSTSEVAKPFAYSQAYRMLAARNLHQCLFVPATASHERLRVTFATSSNFDDEMLPVILIAGPMYGTRYMGVLFDKISCEVGVRVICVDRPGMGGSTPVPVSMRVEVWLDMVPLLLRRLNVEHVSVVSHSAGTVYTMNTILRLRHVLDPKWPYVAFLGPWVHPDQSKSVLWNLASKLPAGMISSMDSFTSLINQRIMPVSSWSGGFVSSAISIFKAGPDESEVVLTDSQELYGTDEDTAKQIDRLRSTYVALEGTKGANHEALLLLKKGCSNGWGVCEDYMAFVQSLVATEKTRLSQGSSSAKMSVRVYLPESDVMIGDEGMKYFAQIWKQSGVDEALDVQIHDRAGTDHETILLNFKLGAIRSVFEEIKKKHS